jgi:hypothetical protein
VVIIRKITIYAMFLVVTALKLRREVRTFMPAGASCVLPAGKNAIRPSETLTARAGAQTVATDLPATLFAAWSGCRHSGVRGQQYRAVKSSHRPQAVV